MPFYETTFIINPQADDSTIDRQVKAVADLITNSGGKVIMENRMGTRKLAYMIGNLAQGYYTNLVFESVVDTLPSLDKHFRLNEEYVRNLTLRYERDPYVELEKKKERETATVSDRPERPTTGAPRVGSPQPATGATASPETEAKPVKQESAAVPDDPKTKAEPVEPESVASWADSKTEAKPVKPDSASPEESVKPNVPSKPDQTPVGSPNDDENEL